MSQDLLFNQRHSVVHPGYLTFIAVYVQSLNIALLYLNFYTSSNAEGFANEQPLESYYFFFSSVLISATCSLA
jgi:hypothetical protein